MDYLVMKAITPTLAVSSGNPVPTLPATTPIDAHARGRLILCALLLIVASGLTGIASAAGAVRPFVSGSLQQILSAREGKPFILVFWSLECQFCPTELKMMGEFKRRYPKLDVVLVATDTRQEIPQLSDRIRQYGADKLEQWVFAEDMPERLRFEVDRRWYGEVPRSQFYDKTHRYEVKTGLVNQKFLEDWLVRQAITP